VFGRDFITLDEAARRSGYHPNTLMRLLRAGVLDGYKDRVRGRYRWMISWRSLNAYTETLTTFASDRPGPRPRPARRKPNDR
jgi:hypothetical protein